MTDKKNKTRSSSRQWPAFPATLWRRTRALFPGKAYSIIAAAQSGKNPRLPAGVVLADASKITGAMSKYRYVTVEAGEQTAVSGGTAAHA